MATERCVFGGKSTALAGGMDVGDEKEGGGLDDCVSWHVS